ncbi:MAG TPA: hypothetical protein VGE11_22725 [Pseudonocardia sp.]
MRKAAARKEQAPSPAPPAQRSSEDEVSGQSLFTPVTPAQRPGAERTPNVFAPGLRPPTPSAPGSSAPGSSPAGSGAPGSSAPSPSAPSPSAFAPKPAAPGSDAPGSDAPSPSVFAPKPVAPSGAPSPGAPSSGAPGPSVFAPKPAAPDSGAPSSGAPGPSAFAPKPGTPGSRVPSAGAPSPSVFAPKPAAPASTPPAPSAPKERAPKERAPKERAPKERAPKERAPKERAPKAPAPAKTPAAYVAPNLPHRPERHPPFALAAFLAVAVATVAAHAVAATFSSVWIATAGEARFAVAVLAIRDAAIAPVALAAWDRLAAIQIAAVQLLLPTGDPVEAARWACLVLGALAALFVWPALRGFGSSLSATSVAVGTLGVALPILALHSAVTTAAAGVVWLSLAAALAVRDRFRAAGIAALLAVVTVPLAAAPLLGLLAYVCLDGTLRLPVRIRKPLGVLAALAAVGVVLATALPGAPLAATTGPDITTGIALAGAALAAVLAGVAALADRLLRPVLAAAAPLVAVWLIAGPSRAAAAILVAPVLAVAVGVVADQVRSRIGLRWMRVAAGVVVAVLLVGPLAVAASSPTPAGGSLTTWVATQTGQGALVVADPLDRAELQIAGVPAARLRTPADPPVDGELRLVSTRPGATVTPCPPEAVLAQTPKGSGGAPAVVCGALTPATMAEGRVRGRFGAQLATNTALKLEPAAAAALSGGSVDPRLMLTLAALTSAHSVGVADFPASPLDAPGSLRRMVVLSSFDGSAPAASQLLRTWLAAQQAPFAPSSVTTDGTDLVLNYPVPSPTGLLPP